MNLVVNMAKLKQAGFGDIIEKAQKKNFSVRSDGSLTAVRKSLHRRQSQRTRENVHLIYLVNMLPGRRPVMTEIASQIS